MGKLFLVREGYLYAQQMLRQALSLFRGIIQVNVDRDEVSEDENEDGVNEIFQEAFQDDDDNNNGF